MYQRLVRFERLNGVIPKRRQVILSCSFGGGTETKSPTPADVDNEASPRVVTTVDSSTGIARVELNRPEKLNALDLAMFEAIRDAAVSLHDNRRVRAVVLSGRGRAFCTGLDVASLQKSGNGNPLKVTKQLLHRHDEHQVANLAQDVAYAWRTLPVPVLAAVQGMCYGGGLQIALGADIRFTTADCQWSIMETKWGLIPDMSASVTLRELVSIDVAKELTWTGNKIDGTEAARLGLVTRVVNDPVAATLALAQDIVTKSPDAVAASKALYNTTYSSPSFAAYCLKVETQLQEQILLGWNQVAAASRSALGWRLPYFQRASSYRLPSPPPSPIQDETKHTKA